MDTKKVIEQLEQVKLDIKDIFVSGKQIDINYKRIDNVITLLKEQKTANFYKCPNCGTWVSNENVIRCKDCKHGRIYEQNLVDCDLQELSKDIDWFCADGSPKEVK